MPYSEQARPPWTVTFLSFLSFFRIYFDTVFALMYPKLLIPPVDLYGKTAIVTGANTGIGYEIARALAGRGARVVIACRDARKGEIARDKLIESTGNHQIELEVMDCASFASVRSFVDRWDKRGLKKVDILINNAGKLSCFVMPRISDCLTRCNGGRDGEYGRRI